MSFREKKHKREYRFDGKVDTGRHRFWFGRVDLCSLWNSVLSAFRRDSVLEILI